MVHLVTHFRSGKEGTGSLFVLDIAHDGINPVQVFEYSDGLFDVAWAENNEHLLVTAAGDGSIQVWDVMQPQVNAVSWSQTRNENLFLSASWDSLIKVWDLTQSQSLITLTGHVNNVYSAVWSPRVPGVISSASGDKTLRVWDLRKSKESVAVIQAHGEEILTCDWCKYDQHQIFSGSVDGTIRGWDTRSYQLPFCELRGHQYAVRRIKTSPFVPTSLASSSYDFTVRTWDITKQKQMEVIEHHTEFVYGLDFNNHLPGQMADCAWDGIIQVYQPQSCTPLAS
ncbi:hypothetical protein C0Q70_11438 [Pomacea canaliculata]|uniref:Peroxin-7 n=1 Tax=Pomacea canaliculata TaxID=400727 RepID=A0A2T7P622_POMCA|nr:hypothetical protein C0Q70_11438 [Pomacea canaliculata]